MRDKTGKPGEIISCSGMECEIQNYTFKIRGFQIHMFNCINSYNLL